MRTRIKICGITRNEDAQCAASLGADAIGLVFYPQSLRHVSVEQARAVVDGLPPFVTVTGLFVNADPQDIQAIINQVSLDLIQFHGDETPEQCAAVNRPYIKAVRVRVGSDIPSQIKTYPRASAILLDTYQENLPGGTGTTFDWSCVPAGVKKPIILAGGLNAENVTEAINLVHPYAVDVSGGVEIEKGIKDADRIAAFIASVSTADTRTL